jgi:tryptophan synthase alpha subunit
MVIRIRKSKKNSQHNGRNIEDTTEMVIRIRKSKNNSQHNGQNIEDTTEMVIRIRKSKKNFNVLAIVLAVLL